MPNSVSLRPCPPSSIQLSSGISDPESNQAPASGKTPFFPHTRWSLILDAREQDPEAVAALCQHYWQPLYLFARRSGQNQADAEDLTQGFFLSVIEKELFGKARRERGRLRSFLLKAFKNFQAHEWRKSQTLKRGGGVHVIEIDTAIAEGRLLQLAGDVTPEVEFERQWARQILLQAKEQLRATYEATGQLGEYKAFEDQLDEGRNQRPYREIAADLNLTEAKARFIGFAFRQRYREFLEQIVADTVASPEEAQDELKHLLSVF